MAGMSYEAPKPQVIQQPTVIDNTGVKYRTMELLKRKKGRAVNMLAGDYYNNNNRKTNSKAIAGQPDASKTLLGE